MRKNNVQCALRNTATGIGAGIIAGFAGTVAITVCQMIERKITDRKEDAGPANAVEKTLDIQPKPGTKKKLAKRVHWVYGTSWGIIRGLLGVCGFNKWVATGLHYGAITGAAMAVAPLEDQNPVEDWSLKEIAIDLGHHAVYALTVGFVFDAIYNGKRN